ncbi:hypothetical protein E2S19_15820 [Salmonella enterica]|nr:hypothetical protein [Salmonella enterica]EAR7755839.1 hypothetical protein [Salmonella enterica]EAR7991514.1 hypothetical protein [Salmonella enterica]EAR8004589.1 hypothetical protein [Salmonella enterica]EAT7325360.1 hypothetical protein [Salmonella enterica]
MGLFQRRSGIFSSVVKGSGEKYSNNILISQSNKGLPFGNPLFNLAEAKRSDIWNPFGSSVFRTEENF